MDEKDLEKGKGKIKDKKDITYEVEKDPEIPMVNDPRAAYRVDEEVEYQKFLNLPEPMRVEFINGRIYYLAAANNRHQELSMRLSARFHNYLHGKSCKVYAAPFDVKIDFDFNQLSRETLQPDLLVICDKKKLSKQGANGAPDLIIEILSPSDPGHDKVFKYNKYLSVGVKEYWIVDPVREEVMVNVLISRHIYRSKVYVKGDIIKASVLDDLHIDVTDLFEGGKGLEIPEVEVAREEERSKIDAEKIEIAKEMIQDQLSTDTILRYTGLSIETICQLKSKKEHPQ
jgi:Uma2 family endonuclease